MEGSGDRLAEAGELAARWRCSSKLVYRMAREGTIPCVSIGRLVRFQWSAILAWEAEQQGSSDA